MPHGTARTFGQWLVDQARRPDPIGDLACDALAGCDHYAEGQVPTTVQALRNEMDLHGACPEAYEALEQAAREWKEAELRCSLATR